MSDYLEDFPFWVNLMYKMNLCRGIPGNSFHLLIEKSHESKKTHKLSTILKWRSTTLSMVQMALTFTPLSLERIESDI